MLNKCDSCNVIFDVFTNGHVSDYSWALCGKCWKIELKNRGMAVSK